MKLYEITPEAFEKHNTLIAEAKAGLDISMFVNQRQAPVVQDGVGIVHLYGTTLSDATPLEKALGNTDYEDLMRDLDTVINAGASAIVLNINSGGGMVSGAIEAAKYIENLPVPTVAFASGLMCSAAYKLGCGTTHIVASPSATIGNIGVIMTLADASQAYAAMGIKFISITNDEATLKSIGHQPGLTDDQYEFLKEDLNAAGVIFKQHVLDNRPAVDTEVFRAGWYSGQKAIDLGLVDEIGSINIALERAKELAQTFTI